MKIQLYKFEKRTNSTLQPSLTEQYIEVDVVLKNSVSIENPIINFKQKYDEYTYAYIPDFNRYYFIVGWAQVRNRWTALMDEDKLASRRAEIFNTNAYILRTSNPDKIDNTIVDTQYPIQSGIDIYQQMFDINGWYQTADATSNSGWFIVGFVNGISQLGAVSYFALKELGFYNIVNRLVNVGPISFDAYMINKVNPLQYIYSAYWTPIDIEAVDAQRKTIMKLEDENGIAKIPIFKNDDGEITVDIDTAVSGPVYYIKDATPLEFSNNILLDISAMDASIPRWLKCQYYKYSLYIPWFGNFEIDPNFIGLKNNLTTIGIRIKVDLTTGSSVVVVSDNANYNQFYENAWTIQHGRFGIDLPISQRGNNIPEVLASCAGSLISGLSLGVGAISNIGSYNAVAKKHHQLMLKGSPAVGSQEDLGEYAARHLKAEGAYQEKATLDTYNPTGGILGAAGGIISSAASAISQIKTETTTRAAVSNWTEAGNSKIILTVYAKTYASDIDVYGAPCFKTDKIGNHAGYYVMATNVSITDPMLDTEKTEIIQLLAGGVYLQ